MASLLANRFLARISHLFLAYDSLLFLNVIEEEALAVRDILQTYENASGQKKINLDKSALVLGKNKSQSQKGDTYKGHHPSNSTIVHGLFQTPSLPHQ